MTRCAPTWCIACRIALACRLTGRVSLSHTHVAEAFGNSSVFWSVRFPCRTLCWRQTNKKLRLGRLSTFAMAILVLNKIARVSKGTPFSSTLFEDILCNRFVSHSVTFWVPLEPGLWSWCALDSRSSGLGQVLDLRSALDLMVPNSADDPLR